MKALKFLLMAALAAIINLSESQAHASTPEAIAATALQPPAPAVPSGVPKPPPPKADVPLPTAPSAGASSSGASTGFPVNSALQSVVFAIVFVLITLIVVWIVRGLPPQWLANTLSESGSPPTNTTTTTAGSPAVTTTSGTSLVGSTSRLIAFMGSLLIMALFVGFGLWVLWSAMNTGKPPKALIRLSGFWPVASFCLHHIWPIRCEPHLSPKFMGS